MATPKSIHKKLITTPRAAGFKFTDIQYDNYDLYSDYFKKYNGDIDVSPLLLNVAYKIRTSEIEGRTPKRKGSRTKTSSRIKQSKAKSGGGQT